MVALLDTAGRFELELLGFEAIPAGDRFLLLRVGGRWSLPENALAPAPRLVLESADGRERFDVLPGAEDDFSRDWWAAYAVPAAKAVDVRFRIEAGEDSRFELPEPVRRELLDGQRPEIVVRGGRPYLLVAAGLMAAAVIPLSSPGNAGADDNVPADPAAGAPAPAAQVVTAGDSTDAPVDPNAPAPPADPTAPAPVPTPAAPIAPAATSTATTPTPVVTTTPAAIPSSPKKHEDAKTSSDDEHAKPKKRHAKKAEKTAKKAKHVKPRHARRKAAQPKPAAPRPQPKPPVVVNHAPTRTVAPSKAVTSTPGPVTKTPSPLLAHFTIPPFLLPIYQAAAAQYDVPWEVLAAINSVETDFGRNVNVSSAGAQGWMQFMPSTWDMYGVDANLDGRKDAGNPADAIFAAARYLKAAGGSQDIRRAIFAYNHAGWYVDMVMAKARALRHMPEGAVSALTGLADGRFPVQGSHVHYSHATGGWVTADAHARAATLITAPVGRQIVAATGGRVIFSGHSRSGAWLVLEDAYGNRFTYGHIGHLARLFGGLRRHTPTTAEVARELGLDRGTDNAVVRTSYTPAPAVARATWPVSKERLFAHPTRPDAAQAGGTVQLDAAPPSVIAAAARTLGVSRSEVVMSRLRPGAEVPAGTILGRVGGTRTSYGRAGLLLRIRPAGKRARSIDPAPLLEAWRLGARGALGPVSAHTKKGHHLGLGRTLLLSDRQLGKLVLRDKRVDLTQSSRDEIRAGMVDRRVLVSLETLAQAGQHPAVAALRSGPVHPSEARDAGRAVDIVGLNGRTIADDGAAAKAAARTLDKLPEALRPARADVSLGSAVRAQAASTSTSMPAAGVGRLTVGFRVAPETSAAVGNAVDAALGAGALTAGPQSGGAPDLKSAPARVHAMADAADAIAGLPYIWGGGHGAWEANGYDCSGSVSYVLHAAGLLDHPMVSGDLASWDEAGAGKWVTIYANPTHVIMKIGDQFYGTSGFGHPETGGGPGWFSVEPSSDYLAGFSVRHPAGL